MEHKFRPFFLQIVQYLLASVITSFFQKPLPLKHSKNSECTFRQCTYSWTFLRNVPDYIPGMVSFWPAAGFGCHWVLESSQSQQEANGCWDRIDPQMLPQLLCWNVCDVTWIDPFRAARNWIMGCFSCSYMSVFRKILTHLIRNQLQAANYPTADKDTKQNLFLCLGWVKIVGWRDESALDEWFGPSWMVCMSKSVGTLANRGLTSHIPPLEFSQ